MGLTEGEAAALSRAAARACAYRRGVPDRPVPPADSLETAVACLRTALDEEGVAPEAVIEALADAAEPGLAQMTSPRFFGFVLGGSAPVGVAADWLVSAWGQNAASARATPAITGIERAVCDWVLDLLGLPGESGAGIVTGASAANAAGVMAARNALLARHGWDVEADGLFGAPPIEVLIGAEAHSAAFAALRYAGLGAGRARRVATDDEGRIDPEDFARHLDARRGPTLVMLQAGQINTGASDPFARLIPRAHQAGAWVHVDGAFGLWLNAVPDLRARTAGVEAADSWAVDLHKWLNAPFDAGLVICRDRAPLAAAMSARGSYLPESGGDLEPTDATFELSRRARGVPSYAILRWLGRRGVRDLVAGHCRLARRAAARLDAIDGLHVLNAVEGNQVALRAGEGEAGDALTRALLNLIQARGRVYPTHGDWRGRAIIRVSVIGLKTTEADIDMLIDEVAAAWQDVRDDA